MNTKNRMNRTNQRKSRELALQVLFKLDCLKEDKLESQKLSFFIYKNLLGELLKISDKPWKQAQYLIDGVLADKSRLDQIVFNNMQDYAKLSNVDKNILRISIFEMSTGKKVNIVINEAIELAKIYSTSESGKLVNRVLDEAKKSIS